MAPCIVCAGTSDLPVAREAARSLAFAGYRTTIVADVGVAGLWRLMRRIDEIRTFPVVIAVAGMEGALFSVLAGLVEAARDRGASLGRLRRCGRRLRRPEQRARVLRDRTPRRQHRQRFSAPPCAAIRILRRVPAHRLDSPQS